MTLNIISYHLRFHLCISLFLPFVQWSVDNKGSSSYYTLNLYSSHNIIKNSTSVSINRGTWELILALTIISLLLSLDRRIKIGLGISYFPSFLGSSTLSI